MLRPIIASLAVLSLAATPLLATAQKGGRASGAGPSARTQSSRPAPAPPPGRAAPAEPVAAPAGEPENPDGPAGPPGVRLDRVIAIVNDGVVTESELQDEIVEVGKRARA